MYGIDDDFTLLTNVWNWYVHSIKTATCEIVDIFTV